MLASLPAREIRRQRGELTPGARRMSAVDAGFQLFEAQPSLPGMRRERLDDSLALPVGDAQTGVGLGASRLALLLSLVHSPKHTICFGLWN